MNPARWVGRTTGPAPRAARHRTDPHAGAIDAPSIPAQWRTRRGAAACRRSGLAPDSSGIRVPGQVCRREGDVRPIGPFVHQSRRSTTARGWPARPGRPSIWPMAAICCPRARGGGVDRQAAEPLRGGIGAALLPVLWIEARLFPSMPLSLNALMDGAGDPDRIRTCDLPLRRRSLYPLSYGARAAPLCRGMGLPGNPSDACGGQVNAVRPFRNHARMWPIIRRP